MLNFIAINLNVYWKRRIASALKAEINFNDSILHYLINDNFRNDNKLKERKEEISILNARNTIEDPSIIKNGRKKGKEVGRKRNFAPSALPR